MTASIKREPSPFRHEALLYEGRNDLVRSCANFLREGVALGERALVVLRKPLMEAIREELNDTSGLVAFADMADIGANPARIIPAWKDFVDKAPVGTKLRGIGEPVWDTRPPEELVECHRHEALLNLAFASAAGFWLLCPYDTHTLPDEVIVEAKRNHPFVAAKDASSLSTDFEVPPDPFTVPLAEPANPPVAVEFSSEHLGSLRQIVAAESASAGLPERRVEDLVLAVHELASNSVRHGGGGGQLRIWKESDYIYCEVRDNGWICNPMAGRERPTIDQLGGRGLWIVHQLCDLVHIRCFDDGGVVRVRMAI